MLEVQAGFLRAGVEGTLAREEDSKEVSDVALGILGGVSLCNFLLTLTLPNIPFCIISLGLDTSDLTTGDSVPDSILCYYANTILHPCNPPTTPCLYLCRAGRSASR